MPYPYTPGPGDLAAAHIPDSYDGLADWEADELAEEQLASTAFEVADFLIDAVQLVDEAKQPVDTMRIHERDIQDAPIHVLLALIMTGTDQQANFARMFLRDHFKRTKAFWIGERAAEILREANGPEPEPEPDPYDDDFHWI